MNRQIDYYFTSISPYTYLGHTLFLQIVNDAKTSVHFKPVILGKVFANSGALPLAQRPECRQNYRLIEIERWAKKRHLPIVLHPAFFPVDPSLADKCVIALQESGENASELTGAVLTACWVKEKNISDETVLYEILLDLGFDTDKIITLSQSKSIQAIYEKNTADAITQGVLGVPSYLLDGEQFWGQDRLELLNDKLK